MPISAYFDPIFEPSVGQLGFPYSSQIVKTKRLGHLQSICFIGEKVWDNLPEIMLFNPKNEYFGEKGPITCFLNLVWTKFIGLECCCWSKIEPWGIIFLMVH